MAGEANLKAVAGLLEKGSGNHKARLGCLEANSKASLAAQKLVQASLKLAQVACLGRIHCRSGGVKLICQK